MAKVDAYARVVEGSGKEFIDLPPALIGGVYSNTLVVRHSPYEFTLDFCVDEGSEAEPPQLVGVARIRIPVAIIFGVIQSLNNSMTEYENAYGEIRPPRLSSDD